MNKPRTKLNPCRGKEKKNLKYVLIFAIVMALIGIGCKSKPEDKTIKIGQIVTSFTGDAAMYGNF